MTKKLRYFCTLLLMAVVGVAWAQSDYSTTETSNVALAAGTNGSACTVNGENGIKVGTSSKGGDMKVTVPAGTAFLHVHAAAWKGVTGLSLNISGATASPASIALTANDGVSNNSPFTLSGNASDYYFVIELSDITAETTLTFTTSIAKRFVIWGVNAEEDGGSGSTLEDNDLALTGAPVALTFDLYDNAEPQVINYTTSSTGAVTIPASNFFETAIDETNKTITVTPVAVTNGVKEAAVNQAADDTYKAGSASFTVDITDSTPFEGGDVTFDAKTDFGNTTAGEGSITKNGVIFSCDNGILGNGNEYRLYKNSTITFSTTSGSITKIEFICKSGNPASGFGEQTGFTLDGNNGIWVGDAESISFVASNKQVQATQIVVTVTMPGDDPYISANNVNIDDYNATGGEIVYTIENEVEGGSVNATTDADWISFGPSFNSPIAFSCEANEGGERTATVTLTYSYGDNESVTKNVTVTQAGNPNAPGTENNPYTVAEALANTPASGTSANVYVRGIVSRFQNEGGIMEDGNNFRYYISDDGTTTSEIQVYRGKGLNNVAFSNNNDLLVGDEVVIYGGLTTYNTTKEIAANNYIVSLNRPTPTDPTVTVNSTSVEVDAAEHDGTITVTCENMGENLDISVFFCEETDVTAPADYDWIDAEIDNQNNVYYVIEANTATEARKAYMVVKVADADAKEVYTSKLITFTQAGKELPSVTWDLSTNSYDEITDENIVTWSSNFATMTNSSKSGGTKATNYLGGDANNRTSSRFYSNNTLTIAPKAGYKITKVEFTATSSNYASALNNSTWTNATAAVDGTNVTVTPTNGNLAMVATIGGNCGFTGVKVYYEESDVMVIKIKEGFTATTFSCDKALDFTGQNIAAYIITDENGATDQVWKVPAGKGLYIVGAEGNYEVPFLVDETEAEEITGNLLVGTISEPVNTKTLEGDYTYYLFGKQNGKEAFFKVGESTSDAKATASAGKAYLAVPGAGNAKEMIVIGGDVTGIESIENGTIVNDNYYTIDGKLVKGQPTQKGIYVVNGRKVVIK